MTPSDLYGATKAACEHLCGQYAGRLGVDVVSARIFFVYGPGRTPGPGAGFNTMLFGPLAGIPEVLLPTGRDQQGDWTYVADAARGIRMLLDAERPLKHAAYNIATGIFHSVDAIVEVVKRCASTPARVEIGPGAILDRGAPLDISRAREELGYEPEYDLERGVRAYGDWLRS